MDGAVRSIVALREGAYAAYLQRGDEHHAATCALTLRREHVANMQDSVAAGWLQRAEHLLEGRPESFADTAAADGYLAIAHADAARARGDFARALGLVDRALQIADGSDDRNLRAWAVMRRGMFLVDEGRLSEGYQLVEQVASAAAGGELGGYTTGAVLINMMSLCRDVATYRRGLEWSDAAIRWLGRQRIEGFPGICRIHRSELLRMLGSLDEAQREAGRACEEVVGISVVHAGVAQHELGEVRLRLGDLEGADDAFSHALELGEDPQPGLALLRLAQGEGSAALALIVRSLSETAFDGFAHARMLSAQAEIAAAIADVARLRASRNALDEIAKIRPRRFAPRARGRTDCSPSPRTIPEPPPFTCATRAIAGTRCRRPTRPPRRRSRSPRRTCSEGNATRRRWSCRRLENTFEQLGATVDARHAASLQERRRRGGTPTRIVRTFLFTDIVSSTSLMGVIGDEAWGDLRRWHDETLRASFVENGGEEIDHAGDGFFVAFPDVPSALASAVEIQRRLVEHRRRTGSRRRSVWACMPPPRPTTGPTTRASAFTRPRGSARWPGAARSYERPDGRRPPGCADLGAAHREPEGHRRAGRCGCDRLARLTPGQPQGQNPASGHSQEAEAA